MFLLADYNNVTIIPAGATNIDIRQLGYRHLPDDENYLGKQISLSVPETQQYHLTSLL